MHTFRKLPIAKPNKKISINDLNNIIRTIEQLRILLAASSYNRQMMQVHLDKLNLMWNTAQKMIQNL